MDDQNKPLPAEAVALVEEARRIADAATPEPWHVQSDGWTVRTTPAHCDGYDGPRGIKVATTGHSGDSVEREVANAEFIARARTLVPEMAAALASQARDLDAARATRAGLLGIAEAAYHDAAAERDALKARLAEVERECDALRVEVTAGRADCRLFMSTRDQVNDLVAHDPDEGHVDAVRRVVRERDAANARAALQEKAVELVTESMRTQLATMQARLNAVKRCRACGADPAVESASGEEPPIVRGALDAQEDAEKRLFAATARAVAAEERAERAEAALAEIAEASCACRDDCNCLQRVKDVALTALAVSHG